MTPPGSPPPPRPPEYGSPAEGPSPWGPLAEWPQRALGLLIDAGIGFGGVLVLYIVAFILGQISSALGVLMLVVAWLAGIGWHIWLAIQVGQTGTSPGMRMIGLRCVAKDTGQPIGAGMGVARAFAHIVDSLICYIGWLFPLWDAQKQTLADKIVGTLVVTAPKQPFSITPPATTSY